MEAIQILKWKIEVDPDATLKAQEMRPSDSPEECSCPDCKNFIEARDVAYPRGFLEILKSLGIPPNRESEIYHLAEIEPGKHLYGGWFHFVGKLLEGPDAVRSSPVKGRFQLEPLTIGFEMALTSELGLVPETFPNEDVVQIEFRTQVPWIMDKPYLDD